MEVVGDVDEAVREVNFLEARDGIDGEHGNALIDKVVGQVVIHQGVVLIGAGCKHDSVASLGFHLVHNLATAGLEGIGKGSLSGIGLSDGLSGALGTDVEDLLHVAGELLVSVLIGVPVEEGVQEGDAELLVRVVAVANDHGIALHHGAHREAGFLGVL